MAKRKKYPRLPNGFGSIRYLGKGRRNPYAVHPPTHLDSQTTALCYVNDYMVGVAVLTAYHTGTYKPGYELTITQEIGREMAVGALTNRILSDYRKILYHFLGNFSPIPSIIKNPQTSLPKSW